MARPPFPFHSHQGDELLYAVADLAPVPTPIVSSFEPCIASGRISSRADSVSAFFKALCQRYRPPPPKAFVDDSDDSEAENATTIATQTFPVDWIAVPEEVSPKDDSLVAEFESLLPKLVPKPLPEKLCGEVLQRAIYKPSGKWAFAAGLPFTECRPSIILSSGVMCSAFLKTGYIGDRQCTLVSKMWLMKEKWHGFFSELALYKLQLKSLQGRVVPAIINVFTCAGAVDVAMEPPHPSFWIEASADMPHVLKKRCVQAFEKLHAVGVLHGDIELRHMVIGGDARVTIIDFQASRALAPNPAVGLAAATSDELRLEMRKIKFKLDYEDARAREDEKLMRAARLARRNQRGRKREEPLPEDVVDPPIDSRVWNLEWVGAPVEPVRFIMPGQSTEDVEHAVEEFLGILERLEQEEKRTHRDGSMTRRRRASPDFKPPTLVPAKPSGGQPPGKGFGATVVTPGTKRQRRPSPNFKLPALPPKSPGKPTTVTPTTLKRKGDCDRPHEAQKRIRANPTVTSSTLPSPPPAHEHPPISTGPLPAPKVRDLVYEMPLRRCSTLPLQPQLTPTRSSAPRLDPSSSSPPSSAKRKRTTDAADEFLERVGRARKRTILASDIPSPPCDHAIPSSVVQSATVSTAVHDAEEVPPVEPRDFVCVPHPIQVLLPTPLLSRFVENMWRLVS